MVCKTSCNSYGNAKRDWRSYKEAAAPLTNKPPKQHPQPTPPPTIKNASIPKPSSHRLMSSRTLGEDTEKTRASLGEIDLEDDYMAAFEGKICEENQEMLERSAIAISHSSESVMDHICSEGVNCINIKAMGGMLHLVIFETFDDKKAIMESKWLDRWFMTVRNVNDQSSALWRETWIRVYGVPLIAWGYENFYKIGCIFGRVLSVNYSEYECAHIQIFTDSLFDSNGKLSMGIGEKTYPIYVSEVRLSRIPQKSASVPLVSPTTKNANPSSSPEKMNSHFKNDVSLTNNNLVVGFPTTITQEPPIYCTPKKPFMLPNENCQLESTKQASLKIGNTSLSSIPRSPNLSSTSKKLILSPSPPSPRSRTKSLLSSPLTSQAQKDTPIIYPQLSPKPLAPSFRPLKYTINLDLFLDNEPSPTLPLAQMTPLHALGHFSPLGLRIAFQPSSSLPKRQRGGKKWRKGES